jgi:CheY-like chemotaxis protein
MLPAGDGYLVIERLNAMPAMEGIPVIVVSALDPKLQEDKLAASGAYAYVQKPFDHEELLAEIERALGS